MRSLSSLVFVANVVALAAVVLVPVLSIAALVKFGWQRGRITLAYLGYLCCAAIAGSFIATFALEGGEILMMFVLWAIPFSVAAAIALVLTLTIRSSHTLWKLALATTLLVSAQIIAERMPGGIGGPNAVLLLGVHSLYLVSVTATSIRHRKEWWLHSRRD